MAAAGAGRFGGPGPQPVRFIRPDQAMGKRVVTALVGPNVSASRDLGDTSTADVFTKFYGPTSFSSSGRGSLAPESGLPTVGGPISIDPFEMSNSARRASVSAKVSQTDYGFGGIGGECDARECNILQSI